MSDVKLSHAALVWLTIVTLLVFTNQQRANAASPTHSDVRYGKFHRNVLDVYLPADPDPAAMVPVVIYLHGGGWMIGDKSWVNATPFLDQGIAVVSANYRFTVGSPDAAPYPAPMNDAARVVQFVRSQAKTWKINPSRIALAGDSAGAVMSMWVAYQNDMAVPDSTDPINRFSTRVTCVLPSNTPTTMDPEWILKHIGGNKNIHVAAFPLFRIQSIQELKGPEKAAMVRAASPVTYVTADDPPTYIQYPAPFGKTPLPESTDQNLSIHHPRFGQLLKERMNAVGVECVFRYKDDTSSITLEQFLKKHLLR